SAPAGRLVEHGADRGAEEGADRDRAGPAPLAGERAGHHRTARHVVGRKGGHLRQSRRTGPGDPLGGDADRRMPNRRPGVPGLAGAPRTGPCPDTAQGTGRRDSLVRSTGRGRDWRIWHLSGGRSLMYFEFTEFHFWITLIMIAA